MCNTGYTTCTWCSSLSSFYSDMWMLFTEIVIRLYRRETNDWYRIMNFFKRFKAVVQIPIWILQKLYINSLWRQFKILLKNTTDIITCVWNGASGKKNRRNDGICKNSIARKYFYSFQCTYEIVHYTWMKSLCSRVLPKRFFSFPCRPCFLIFPTLSFPRHDAFNRKHIAFCHTAQR